MFYLRFISVNVFSNKNKWSVLLITRCKHVLMRKYQSFLKIFLQSMNLWRKILYNYKINLYNSFLAIHCRKISFSENSLQHMKLCALSFMKIFARLCVIKRLEEIIQKEKASWTRRFSSINLEILHNPTKSGESLVFPFYVNKIETAREIYEEKVFWPINFRENSILLREFIVAEFSLERRANKFFSEQRYTGNVCRFYSVK